MDILTSIPCIPIPETLSRVCPKTMCCGLEPGNYTLQCFYRLVWLVYIYIYIYIYIYSKFLAHDNDFPAF